jgi:hypothetical protein
MGHPDNLAMLARPLQAHHLSVFAPRQVWTLQGDLVLHTVKLGGGEGTQEPRWIDGLDPRSLPWSDSRRLNLVLPAPQRIEWTVAIPRSATRALFRTSIGIVNPMPEGSTPIGIPCEVSAHLEDGSTRSFFAERVSVTSRRWSDIEVSLLPFRGSVVTLELSASRETNEETSGVTGQAVFRSPKIDVVAEASSDGEPVTPSNVELSPFFPSLSDGDLILDPALGASMTERHSLGEFSHVVVGVKAPSTLMPRAVSLDLKLDTGDRSVTIPLLGDDKAHQYSFELRFLESPRAARVLALGVRLATGTPRRESDPVLFTSLRLVRRVPGSP